MHARPPCAAEYLKRVAALTGAEKIRGDSYWFRARHRNFLIDQKFVHLISQHPKSAKRGSGCVRITTPEQQSETVFAIEKTAREVSHQEGEVHISFCGAPRDNLANA